MKINLFKIPFIYFLLLIVVFFTHPLVAEEEKKDEKTAEKKEEKPKKEDKNTEATEHGTRVKLEMNVSRFGDDSVKSLVSYLFFFQCDSMDTSTEIYNNLSWFRGSIIVKLTEYLSNPAHDPKDLGQLKVFLMKLANKAVNDRYTKKDENGKLVFRKYITNVYINKVFERKLK